MHHAFTIAHIADTSAHSKDVTEFQNTKEKEKENLSQSHTVSPTIMCQTIKHLDTLRTLQEIPMIQIKIILSR